MASIRWVRPDFTTPLNSSDFLREARREVVEGRHEVVLISRPRRGGWRWGSVVGGLRAFTVVRVDLLRPRRPEERVASTSFMFMFVEVPHRSGRRRPGTRSWWPRRRLLGGLAIASATSQSIEPISRSPAPRPLDAAPARDRRGLDARPEIGKFSTARWVCAPRGRRRGRGRPPSCRARRGILRYRRASGLERSRRVVLSRAPPPS